MSSPNVGGGRGERDFHPNSHVDAATPPDGRKDSHRRLDRTASSSCQDTLWDAEWGVHAAIRQEIRISPTDRERNFCMLCSRES